MDATALLLARLQFGLTLSYHFWFVALTLGLSVLIALMETVYVRTGAEVYRAMARFWGRLFVVNYAVGVATGLVNEFQFGMNWSEYSRLVGPVFGPSLAFEALTAFFVESVAIGAWVYGWDKLSRRTHAAMIWLVAAAANYSAFWILSANAFMQHPVGFAAVGGRLELTDLWAVMNNRYLAFQFAHTVMAGLTTAGFFVVGVSAFFIRRGRHVEVFRRSLGLGLRWALTAAVLVMVSGHFYNQYLAAVQPMKMAASEALWETAGPAPFVVFAVIDEEKRENRYQLTLPSGLSVLAYNSLNTPVRGMNELEPEYVERYGPGNYVPPVTVLFWSFRLMVAVGVWLALLAAANWWCLLRGRLERRPGLLRADMWSVPLAYVANTLGWVMAEVGRQPWLVYGLLPTAQGVSAAVPAASVGLSLAAYAVVYSLVAAAAVAVAARIVREGPEAVAVEYDG
jgi:cytochrome d ubiquinol oxidase subunit I